MKYTTKKITIAIIAFSILTLGVAALFTSCYVPSPLYGKWMDSTGSQSIEFHDDGTFNASFLNTDGKSSDYAGDWATVDSTLLLNITTPTTYSRYCEWDLRGAVLQLIWTSNDNITRTLILYHVSRG